MNGTDTLIAQASAVAIKGRALLFEGPPGAGKSSLALALIEHGARLIGDDGVTLLRTQAGELIAAPPPRIEGLLEVRGVGLLRLEPAQPAPVALILRLVAPVDPDPERLPDALLTRDCLGCAIPVLPFRPGDIAPAERALAALRMHGLR